MNPRVSHGKGWVGQNRC